MGKIEATDKEKAALTKASENAVKLSQTLPVEALAAPDALATALNQKLDTFIPFDGSGSQTANVATNILLGPIVGVWRAATQETWASSQTIRSNCGQARSNVKARTGQVDRRVQGPLKEVYLTDEMTGNVASKEFARDVKKTADECLANPMKCVGDPTANLWEKFWSSVPLSAKIVGGAALLGMTLFYVGPVIRAGGMLVTRIVGPKKNRRK